MPWEDIFIYVFFDAGVILIRLVYIFASQSTGENQRINLFVLHYTTASVPLRQIFSGIGPVPKFVVSRLVGSQSGDGRAKSKR